MKDVGEWEIYHRRVDEFQVHLGVLEVEGELVAPREIVVVLCSDLICWNPILEGEGALAEVHWIAGLALAAREDIAASR